MKEIWIPQSQVILAPRGKELLKAFDRTKVSKMGVDAYLEKRSSVNFSKKFLFTNSIYSNDNKNNKKSINKNKNSNKNFNNNNEKFKDNMGNRYKLNNSCETTETNVNVINNKKYDNLLPKTNLKRSDETNSEHNQPQSKKHLFSSNNKININRNLTKRNSKLNKNITDKFLGKSSNFNKKLLLCYNGLSDNVNQMSNNLKVYQEFNNLKNSERSLSSTCKSTTIKFNRSSSIDSVLPSLKCNDTNHSHYICCVCSEKISMSSSLMPPFAPTAKSLLSDKSTSYPYPVQSGKMELKDSGPLISKIGHKKTRDGDSSLSIYSNSSSLNKGVPSERRLSIRQMEGACRMKEMTIRKYEGFVHLVLGSECNNKGFLKNAFNPYMFSELCTVLRNLMLDNCRVVLISGSGDSFSSGVDLYYLLHGEQDRKIAAIKMAHNLREFVDLLISFPKPIVAAVNGPAAGLAVAMLPLLDLVYASDKASFSCPYVSLGQTPEACSSYTFPKIMGPAMANEMLIRGRKITALEAHQCGLVTQVFWPENFLSEVIPRVQNIVQHHTKAVCYSKSLMRSRKRPRLEEVNGAESEYLIDRWPSNETQARIRAYVE